MPSRFMNVKAPGLAFDYSRRVHGSAVECRCFVEVWRCRGGHVVLMQDLGGDGPSLTNCVEHVATGLWQSGRLSSRGCTIALDKDGCAILMPKLFAANRIKWFVLARDRCTRERYAFDRVRFRTDGARLVDPSWTAVTDDELAELLGGQVAEYARYEVPADDAGGQSA